MCQKTVTALLLLHISLSKYFRGPSLFNLKNNPNLHIRMKRTASQETRQSHIFFSTCTKADQTPDFNNHKVTSGKLISTTNPGGRRLLRTKRPQTFYCLLRRISPGKFQQLHTIETIIVYASPHFLSHSACSSDESVLKTAAPLRIYCFISTQV